MSEQPVWRESTLPEGFSSVLWQSYPFGFRYEITGCHVVKVKQPHKLQIEDNDE